LFICNIPWESEEKDLAEYLNKFTTVKDVMIARDKETNKSRGFGFATCADVESANRILKLSHQLGKRILTISKATPEKIRGFQNSTNNSKKSSRNGSSANSRSPKRNANPTLQNPISSIFPNSDCPHTNFVNVTSQHPDFKPKCDACSLDQTIYIWECSYCKISLCKTCKEKLEEERNLKSKPANNCPHNGGYFQTASFEEATGDLNINYEGTCEGCGNDCPNHIWNCSMCKKKFCNHCKKLNTGKQIKGPQN
jgi:RNA recognition motif-containing protein